MRKKTKTQIIVLAIILAAILIFVLLMDTLTPKEKEVLEVPEGGLSDSLFESQNPDYVKDELLPVSVACKNIPYLYDTIESDGAVVDTGIIYPTDGAFIYVSEIPRTSSMSSVISDQFSKALKFDAAMDNVGYVTLKNQQGFANGYTAEYEADYISVQDDTNLSGAYIIAYRLYVSTDEYPYDLIVGCATTTGTSEALQACQQMGVRLIYTVRYDEKRDEEMRREREQAAKAAEREAKENEKETSSSSTSLGSSSSVIINNNTDTHEQDSNSSSSDSSSNAETTSSLPLPEEGVEVGGYVESSTTLGGGNGSDTSSVDNPEMTEPSDDMKTMGVLLKTSYNDLTVRVHWDNKEAMPLLVMSDVKGEHSWEPEARGEGYVDFHIGNAAEGVYMVAISNYSGAGNFSSELLGQ